MAEQPLVGIIMGSKSDLGVMEDCGKQLEELGVHNARYLPNFKQIQIVDRDWLTWETHDPV